MNVDYMVYDSVHKRYPCTVCFKKYGDKVYLIVNGIEVQFFNSKDPTAIPWGACGADYICESTGVSLVRQNAELHIKGGAKKVIISAPLLDDVPICVVGVNHKDYKILVTVVSNASCTANCWAPLTKGFLPKLHAMTAT